MWTTLPLISPRSDDFQRLATYIQTNDCNGLNELLDDIMNICPHSNLLDFHTTEHDTALSKACVYGNIEIVRILVFNGAGINVYSNGLTPLIKAVLYNRLELVSYLIEVGVNVNQPAQDSILSNLSPLMYASQHNRVDIVLRLLVAGADVNFQDHDRGNTALILASFFGHTEVARILLYFGANPKAVNSSSLTAFQIAQERKNLEIVELLLWGPSHDPKEKDEQQLVYEVGIRPNYSKALHRDVDVEATCEDADDEDYINDANPTYHTFIDLNNSDSD